MNGMEAADLEFYKDGDSNALHTGAVHYSDAVVIGAEDADPEVLNFVKNSSKPILDFDGALDFENYYNLYEEIVDEETVSLA